ncbi:S1C family serine protease [Chelatococcus asaccharovorans]|uniref:Trypsin-like peptidase n=1 Tax=Chelatococcus asaccharovorans TaxID=28210 RepID=A0A2V3TX84_9HYPH|nr:serine protease [Chelatococcus asaccharovorans]MBS7705196.1 serine protease [Chelatococcus asaccharovorans]PXW53693.1 trypsin-like peptidase [Chelatococcus asaccharovorans]
MRTRIVALTLLAFASLPTVASAQRRDPYFQPAQQAFLSLKPETRLWFQLFLTSAGHWPAVPNVGFSRRLFEATRQYQLSRGETPTGVLTETQVTGILDSGVSVLKSWRLRWVPHPTRGRLLWVPMGLDLQATRTSLGVEMRAPRNRLLIKFNYLPFADVRTSYESTLREMVGSGDHINFKVLKADFFVITGNQGRYSRYVRYHNDGEGILGFDMSWGEEEAPVYGSRLVTIVSGSFWASMTGAPFPTTLRASYPWEREEPEVASAPREQQPRPSAPTPPEHPKASFSTGSGFFVSKAGHIVTNAHVVNDCSTITARPDGAVPLPAQVLAKDKTNDLAVVKVQGPVENTLPIRASVRLGEGIAAFGFPHTDVLATTGNFTLGNVTALAGLRDDSRYLQVSAPVQSGNSGGPLIDGSGNVVGVVSAKLDAIRMAASQGDLPQNVNFAVKATLAASFLDANQVPYETGLLGEKLDPADLASRAKKASVFIVCR